VKVVNIIRAAKAALFSAKLMKSSKIYLVKLNLTIYKKNDIFLMLLK